MKKRKKITVSNAFYKTYLMGGTRDPSLCCHVSVTISFMHGSHLSSLCPVKSAYEILVHPPSSKIS